MEPIAALVDDPVATIGEMASRRQTVDGGRQAGDGVEGALGVAQDGDAGHQAAGVGMAGVA